MYFVKGRASAATLALAAAGWMLPPAGMASAQPLPRS